MTFQLIQAIKGNNATSVRQCLDSCDGSGELWTGHDLELVRSFRCGSPERVKRSSLLRTDIDVYNATLLILAIIRDNEEIVDTLLKHGEGINDACSVRDTCSSPPDYSNVSPLLLTCILGKVNMAKMLVEAGVSVNEPSSLGDTPLFEACYDGQLTLVSYLVQNGADIDAANSKGVTCLMITAYVGNLDIAKFLVNNGADVKKRDKRGRNVLFYCIAGGKLELLKFFLGHVEMTTDSQGMTALMEASLNCNIDIIKYLIIGDSTSNVELNATDKNGRNVLFYCCESGKENFDQVFDCLFRGGVHITSSQDGRTLMMLACLKGHFSVVEFLIRKSSVYGININEKDNRGRNCLFYCITGGQLKILEYLLHEGVRAENSSDSVSILMQAAGKGKSEIAIYLIKHAKQLRLDIHHQDKDGWNCVFYAVAGGHASLCQTLLRNGAKVATSGDGRTVLMQAAACGHVELVRFLLDNYYSLGLDVQDKDSEGWNAAFHSIHSGKLEILEFLVKRGARIEPALNGETLLMEAAGQNKTNFVNYLVENAQRLQINPKDVDKDGNNLLFYAASSGNLDLFERCRHLGTDVQTDGRGRTVLMQAAYGGHVNMCGYLVKNDVVLGIDINARDNQGHNALFYTVENGNIETLQLLIKHGVTAVTDLMGKTVLMQAAFLGHYNIVEYLVSYSSQLNIDIHAGDRDGENVLFYAQRSGKADVIKRLLEAGVAITVDANGRNVVQESIRSDRLDLLKLFVTCGKPSELAEISWDYNYGTAIFQQSVLDGDVRSVAALKHFYKPVADMDSEGLTSLMKACQRSDSIMVMYLLSVVKVDVHPQDKHQKNALFHATESGNFDSIRHLVEHGAKPEADDRGRTIAMVAAEKGNALVVDYILNLGGGAKFVNSVDNENRNIAHFCALGGDQVMLKVLIKNGCNIDLPDANGITPLMLAAAKRKTMLVSRLLKEGALIYGTDAKFRTALHHCCDVESPSITCIGTLVYRGADVNARDDLGETALMKVCDRGNVVAAKCLLDRGADPILHDYQGRETVHMVAPNNPMLKKLLRHYSIMHPHLQWVLEEFREELVCIVDVSRILPLMQRDHVISPELELTILRQETTRGKMEKLIDVLKVRSDKAFTVLCKSLKKDYKPIAYEMEMFAYTREEEVFA